ncbi:MAG: hypothetical protein WA883_21360, partial [Phormidesmis sp.]
AGQSATGQSATGQSAAESAAANPLASNGSRDPKAAAGTTKLEAQTAETKQTPEPVLTGFRFVGGGFGHGVGMSQTGAYNLGRKGYSHQQILEFYYPGTSLQPISESITFWDEN